MTALVDMKGRPLVVGQRVIKAVTHGRSAFLEERVVTKIENGKVYLDGARLVALNHPSRILIMEDCL